MCKVEKLPANICLLHMSRLDSEVALEGKWNRISRVICLESCHLYKITVLISTETIQEAKSNAHPYISYWMVCVKLMRLYVYSVPDCQDWFSQIPQWGKISPPGWSYPSLLACRVQIQQHCTQIKIQTSASVIPTISENDWWKTGAENELCTYPTCRSPSRSASSRSMVVILLVSTHLISNFCRLSM